MTAFWIGIGAILIFFAGFYAGMYALYRGILKKEDEIYRIVSRDLFEWLTEEGYRVVKVRESNDH